MNFKEIKREIKSLESNLKYIEDLTKAVESESIRTLTYKMKNVSSLGEIDIGKGWGFLEGEFKQSLCKEIERTNDANEGISERLGMNLETLLKGTGYDGEFE